MNEEAFPTEGYARQRILIYMKSKRCDNCQKMMENFLKVMVTDYRHVENQSGVHRYGKQFMMYHGPI